MATKAAVPLINLIPPVAKRCRTWRGEFKTSSPSSEQGMLVCEGLRDRGFNSYPDIANHWIYEPDQGRARRVLGFDPETNRLEVSAGSTFEPGANVQFWVLTDSPHVFIEALAHCLSENPALYTLDQDYVLTLTDDDDRELSGQAINLNTFAGWDLANPTRGSWRRFHNHIELWMAGVDRVLEVRGGAAIQGSTFSGYDGLQNFDYLVRSQDWSWDTGASTLRLPGYLWDQTVLITAELETFRADQLLALTLENARDLSIGSTRSASSIYGKGVDNLQIAALVDLTVATWLANQLPSLTGEQNLETKRLETSMRNRARELSPIPDAVFGR